MSREPSRSTSTLAHQADPLPKVKQSAYALEMIPSPKSTPEIQMSAVEALEATRNSVPVEAAVIKQEVLSDSSEEELSHDDPFLFRQMGRKFRDKLKKLSNAIFTKREGSLEETQQPDRSNLFASQLSIALQSSLQVPAYEINPHKNGLVTLPIILGLVKLEIEDEQTFNVRSTPIVNALFKIKLTYESSTQWIIHRRVYDFIKLHVILSFKNVQSGSSWKLPHLPNQLSYIFDTAAFKSMNHEERREHKLKLVRERKESLCKYLCELLSCLNMMPCAPEVFEFLEISRLSISLIKDKETKFKEGYLKNRIFDTRIGPKWYSCLLCYIPDRRKYRTKWFVIKSSYLAFVDNIDQTTPSDVFLCDKEFHTIVENEHVKGMQFLKPLTITIVNGTKKLEVRSESNVQINYWLEALRRLSIECVWCRPHRFNSFAPIRRNCRLEWLIDAEQYYSELVKSIEAAREEIFIHGWWVSPELFLQRPPSEYPNSRLDKLLQKKAQEGVKIYILIFKEFSMALPLNSYHTKNSLEKLHPNIRVQRHPDHLGGILYWAHHEKVVVIDQNVAFTGGLDLCFGRYDTQLHSLIDTSTAQTWVGLDYSNPRIRDFRNVIQYTATTVDRQTTPRMPWHDVHMKVYDAPARDLGRHFIERWNFVKSKKSMHREAHIPFLLPKPDYPINDDEDAATTTAALIDHDDVVKIQAVRSVAEWSMGTTPETSVYDAYMHYIENAKHFIYIENQFFISKSAESHSTPIKNRIAQALVERIIQAHSEGEPFKVIVVLPLLPAFEAPLHRSEASSLRMIMQGQYSGISRGPKSLLGQLAARGIKADDYISFYSLRNYTFLEGKAITEQIYVHSKVMIVDDKVALVGSANINDRSMLGSRDSEVVLIIEGQNQVEATFHGKTVKISKKVRELRTKLLQEHLGLLSLPFTDPAVEAIADITADSFYRGVLRKQAALNTQLYRELFHCVPDDCVDTWEEYRRFTETPRVHVLDEKLGINSLEMLQSIKGSLVLFPTQFLKKEDLAASLLSFESFLPIEVYL